MRFDSNISGSKPHDTTWIVLLVWRAVSFRKQWQTAKHKFYHHQSFERLEIKWNNFTLSYLCYMGTCNISFTVHCSFSFTIGLVDTLGHLSGTMPSLMITSKPIWGFNFFTTKNASCVCYQQHMSCFWPVLMMSPLCTDAKLPSRKRVNVVNVFLFPRKPVWASFLRCSHFVKCRDIILMKCKWIKKYLYRIADYPD